ncbi:hypothetical protein HHK36_028221 [Tetracentron sinense]|uniref:60S ribosomal protein L35a n=1 Tax=Tetracentron sinense TaxID=13715 RepID=A0A834YJK0_TETSI|nr:hypothetical protein HHK36_028221 [Tetracentron sinense]
MVKGRQGERVRLYVRGTILGYKRSKSNQYPNTSLIQIEGMNTKEEVTWYHGKCMACIYKVKVKKKGSHYQCIWGKVTRPHGNSGVVRAKFKSNLPPKSMGSKVSVFVFIKWTPHFKAGSEPSLVRIWISLPHLPIHLYNVLSLSSIGNIVGKVLKIDGPTLADSRPSVARICIEVDLLKVNPDRFWLEKTGKPMEADPKNPVATEDHVRNHNLHKKNQVMSLESSNTVAQQRQNTFFFQEPIMELNNSDPTVDNVECRSEDLVVGIAGVGT